MGAVPDNKSQIRIDFETPQGVAPNDIAHIHTDYAMPKGRYVTPKEAALDVRAQIHMDDETPNGACARR